MFWYVPVEAAVVSCCALGDVDAGDSECFPWYFRGCVGGGLWDGEGPRDKDEFVVWALCELLGRLLYMVVSRRREE